jgi:hypothetical protein
MGNQQVVSEAEKSGEWSNFAPVCRYEALRLFFLLCVIEDLEMDVCDIQVAFLNAPIPAGHEDIYICDIPKDMVTQTLSVNYSSVSTDYEIRRSCGMRQFMHFC